MQAKGLMPTIFLLVLCTCVSSAGAQELQKYQTEYYTIWTDLPEASARQAAIRMDKMAQEYIARTRDFSGTIRGQMPFYVYKNPQAYYATGAPRTSGGYFNGDELVALAEDLGPRTWHTVQHEAFHQFARQVIRGELPMWLGEGLAEYFGEALFTGDGFVSGVIPQWRLKRIRETFAAGKFRPLQEMMSLSPDQWNSDLAIANYDQGWSMVQFLAHAENGRYQRVLGAFIAELGNGRDWKQAWSDTFGDVQGFEKKWREYWTKLPDNPTIDSYASANVATLSSFLARAISQQEKFSDFAALEKSASEGELKSHPEDWLPADLLKQALEQSRVLSRAGYKYELTTRRGERLPQIICTAPDGKQIIGRYSIGSGRVISVNAEIVNGRSQ